MSTVAIIGGDGAGKTTVTKHLLNTLPFPVKCIYMGRNFNSSNVALPTSRLIQFLRAYSGKKAKKIKSSKIQSLNATIQQPKEWWEEDRRGNCYPKPDIVIYLDAPPEELFSRKGETTIEYLQMCRERFLSHREKIANFRQVDALQPVDTVCSEIRDHIDKLLASKKP
jgi:thymidylate kinase